MKVDISDSPAETIIQAAKNLLRKYLLIEPNPGGINLHNFLFNLNDYAFKILSWSAGLAILKTIQDNVHSGKAIAIYYIFGFIFEIYLISITLLIQPRSDLKNKYAKLSIFMIYYIFLLFLQYIIINVFEEAILSVLAMK